MNSQIQLLVKKFPRMFPFSENRKKIFFNQNIENTRLTPDKVANILSKGRKEIHSSNSILSDEEIKETL